MVVNNPEDPDQGNNQSISNQTITDSKKELFLNNLLNSEKVYIIMDVRNVSNQTIKGGILQCGVDFAGSPGLSGKNITSFAFEDDVCWAKNQTTIEECLEISQDGSILYVASGVTNEYFENKLVVSINGPYEANSCNIEFV